MNRTVTIQNIGCILLICFLFSGCSPKKKIALYEKSRDALTCIAVLPTQTPVNWKDSISFKQAQDLDQGAAFADSVLKKRLGGSGHFRFVDEPQLGGPLKHKRGARLEQLRFAGKTMSCNGVLVLTLNRYLQRVGSSYSVESAASAALELELISTHNGRPLCWLRFDETQEPLLSNLFSMKKASKRGFKWVQVEELVGNGIEELLTKCPYIILR